MEVKDQLAPRTGSLRAGKLQILPFEDLSGVILSKEFREHIATISTNGVAVTIGDLRHTGSGQCDSLGPGIVWAAPLTVFQRPKFHGADRLDRKIAATRARPVIGQCPRNSPPMVENVSPMQHFMGTKSIRRHLVIQNVFVTPGMLNDGGERAPLSS